MCKNYLDLYNISGMRLIDILWWKCVQMFDFNGRKKVWIIAKDMRIRKIRLFQNKKKKEINKNSNIGNWMKKDFIILEL